MSARRLAAIAALLLGLGGLGLAVVVAVQEFPRGLIALACVAVAAAADLVRDPATRRGEDRGPRDRSARARRGDRAAGERRPARGTARRRRARAGLRLRAGRVRLPRAPARRAGAEPAGVVLSTRSRVAARRSVSRWRRGAGARDRADRARPALLGPRGARARRGRRRSGRARDGRRRRLAGDRRCDRRRARSALRLRAGGHAQPLRARPRRRSRRRRRRARRVRRRRRAASWTWPRSTGACSSTTSRSGSTPTPSSARATATPSCARCSTPCPTCSAPTRPGPTCAGPARAGTNTTRG